MTAEADVLGALVTGTESLEASRRVGWAKAYEGQARIESLEEQIRVLTDELKTTRRAYSRLVGFVSNLPGRRSEAFIDEVKAHVAAERTFRRQDAWEQGRSAAWAHGDAVASWDTERASRRDRERAEKIARHTGIKAITATLFAEAEALGHVVDSNHRPNDGVDTAQCSCGERNLTDGWAWKRDHVARLVRGVSWAELSASVQP